MTSTKIFLPVIKIFVKKTLFVGKILFHRHLLITNTVFSTLMGGAGDLIEQHYEILMGKKDHLNITRTFHMCIAGMSTGATSHYWYIFLDKWLPNKCFKTVMKKVLYDQILFSPVCLTVYFGTLGLLRGLSVETFKEELLHKGSTIYKAEWIIWPPAQMLNFYVLPTRFRVVFDNFISLGFDIYSPYVVYKKSY